MLVFWFHALKSRSRNDCIKVSPSQNTAKICLDCCDLLTWCYFVVEDARKWGGRDRRGWRCLLEAFSSFIKSLNGIELWWTQNISADGEFCFLLNQRKFVWKRILRQMRNYNKELRIIRKSFRPKNRFESIINNGDDRLVDAEHRCQSFVTRSPLACKRIDSH